MSFLNWIRTLIHKPEHSLEEPKNDLPELQLGLRFIDTGLFGDPVHSIKAILNGHDGSIWIEYNRQNITYRLPKEKFFDRCIILTKEHSL